MLRALFFYDRKRQAFTRGLQFLVNISSLRYAFTRLLDTKAYTKKENVQTLERFEKLLLQHAFLFCVHAWVDLLGVQSTVTRATEFEDETLLSQARALKLFPQRLRALLSNSPNLNAYTRSITTELDPGTATYSASICAWTRTLVPRTHRCYVYRCNSS